MRVNDILDEISANLISGELSANALLEFSRVQKCIESSIKFKITESDSIPVDSGIIFQNLPFPRVYLEFDYQQGRRAFLLEQNGKNDDILIICFGLHGDNKKLGLMGLYIQITKQIDGRVTFSVLCSKNMEMTHDNKFYMQYASQWCSNIIFTLRVMNCSNIIYVSNAPNESLNKKRLKKGRLPFFEFKTLAIKPSSREVNILGRGGTHASPRVHFRRGHIRKLPSGESVWVQQCMVGNKKKWICA